jgi:hypothetical protein
MSVCARQSTSSTIEHMCKCKMDTRQLPPLRHVMRVSRVIASCRRHCGTDWRGQFFRLKPRGTIHIRSSTHCPINTNQYILLTRGVLICAYLTH